MSRGVAGSGQSENLTMHLVSMLVRGRAVAAVFSSCTAECGTLTWTVGSRYTETRYIKYSENRYSRCSENRLDTVESLVETRHWSSPVCGSRTGRTATPGQAASGSRYQIYLYLLTYIYSHVMTHLVNAEPPVGRVTLHPLHHTHPRAVVQLDVNYVLRISHWILY